MIGRLWRVRIDPARAVDYDRFVEEHSRPMFAGLAGLVDVLFLRAGDERLVISLWDSEASIVALAQDDRYRSTVERLEGSGILAGEPTVEVFSVDATLRGEN